MRGRVDAVLASRWRRYRKDSRYATGSNRFCLRSPGPPPSGARAEAPATLLLMQLAAYFAARPLARMDVGIGNAFPDRRRDLGEGTRLDALPAGRGSAR